MVRTMKSTESLEKALISPGRHRRSVQIIHSYFPKTPEQVKSFLDTAEKNGLGGFCVNMDHGVYLSEGTPEADAAWEALRLFIEACFCRGFSVWIYDEKAYPSGAANDLVLKTDPDYQVKGLICRTFTAEGGIGTAESDPGTAKYAAAYPVDESGILIRTRALPVTVSPDDGRILWNLPDGQYRICAFYTRPVNFLTENRIPYVDLMRADVTDRFIEVTHEAYRRHLGDDIIRKITAFFTDEPGLPVHGCSSFFYEKNAVCAWTEAMDSLLPSDMAEHYVSLFFDTDNTEKDAAFRRIYWQTAAKLFAENYFGRIAAWCGKHGTRLTGHLYGEETLSMQIGLNADLFGLMRHMQAPGVDRLYCTDPRDVTAEKTASSAAHLYGRDLVMSENSFHLEHNFWHTPENVTAGNRLNSAYYQIQLGLTNTASYFSYPNAPDDERRIFEEHFARASEFCSAGRHETDVLVLIPMPGAYERFTVPDHKYWNVGPCIEAPHQPESVRMLETAYGTVLEELENARFDFDLIDETGLADDVTAENGTLRTPYETFRNLVIFDSGLVSPGAQRTIRTYLAGGGHITVVDTDRPTAFLRELADTFPALVTRCAYTEITGRIHAAPVLRIAEPLPCVRVRKSRTDHAELWFLHNRSGEDASCTVRETGYFTVYTADMEKYNIRPDDSFTIRIPAHGILMLTRENEPDSGNEIR